MGWMGSSEGFNLATSLDLVLQVSCASLGVCLRAGLKSPVGLTPEVDLDWFARRSVHGVDQLV